MGMIDEWLIVETATYAPANDRVFVLPNRPREGLYSDGLGDRKRGRRSRNLWRPS